MAFQLDLPDWFFVTAVVSSVLFWPFARNVAIGLAAHCWQMHCNIRSRSSCPDRYRILSPASLVPSMSPCMLSDGPADAIAARPFPRRFPICFGAPYFDPTILPVSFLSRTTCAFFAFSFSSDRSRASGDVRQGWPSLAGACTRLCSHEPLLTAAWHRHLRCNTSMRKALDSYFSYKWQPPFHGPVQRCAALTHSCRARITALSP